MPKITVSLKFDAKNGNVIKWAKKHAAELVTDITKTTRELIRDGVVVAFKEGTTPAQLADILEQIIDDEDRAELIARNETMIAASKGQRFGWDQAVDKGLLDGNEKREWITTPDDSLCDFCDALDGKKINLDGEYPDPGGEGPPLHVNCIPGDVVVEGNVIAATRMLYAGQVCEIVTISGRRLTVTTNHPIATNRGFLPANQVNEGDDLFLYSDGVEDISENSRTCNGSVTNPLFTSPQDKQHGPTKIEDVFGSFLLTGKLVITKRFGDEFHSDAYFGDGDIDIVYADIELGNYIEAILLHNRDSFGFETSDSFMASLSNSFLMNESCFLTQSPSVIRSRAFGKTTLKSSIGTITDTNSHSNKLFCEFTPPKSTFDRKTEQRFSFFVSQEQITNSVIGDRNSTFSHTIKIGATSQLDAILFKMSGQRRSRDASFVSEFEKRLPGLVTRDQIVKIRNIEHFGHVYDLNTVSGVILANNFIISNCRCTEGIVYG